MDQNMSKNNQNNVAAWAKRVREYDGIPDNPVYSKEEAWEILKERQKNKPAKRQLFIYWAAASVITVMIIGPLWWSIAKNAAPKGQTKSIVILPAIKNDGHPQQKTNDVLLPTIARNKETKKRLPVNAIDKKPEIDIKRQNLAELKKDTTALIAYTNDSSVVNSHYISLTTNKGTDVQTKKQTIIHINNTTEPAPEYNRKKVQQFLNRYDVDVPVKSQDPAPSINSPILKNLN